MMKDDRPVTDLPDNLAAQLEAYLDGALAPAERAAFERLAAADPVLRREVALARRIEISLKDAFSAPAHIPVPAEAHRSVLARIGFDRVKLWVSAAACVALIGMAVWIWNVRYGQPAYRPMSVAEVIYDKQVRGGWEPEWVCKDDAEFAKAVTDRLGQGLLVHPQPDLTVVGWAYSAKPGDSYATFAISKDEMILLTKVDGRRVMGLVDRAGAGPQPRLTASSKLNLFERQVGDLIIYELTPLEESHILAQFFDPNAPAGDNTAPSPVRRCPSPAP
jgi:hypothetical protein